MVLSSTGDFCHFNPSQLLLHLTGRNWGSSCCRAELPHGVKPGQWSPKAKECRNLGNTAERMPWGLFQWGNWEHHTFNPSQLESCSLPPLSTSCLGSDAVGNQYNVPLDSDKANSRQFLKLDQKEVKKLSDKMQSAGASLHQSKETNSSCHYWLQDFKPDYRNLPLFITAGRTWVSCSSFQVQFQPFRPLSTPPKQRN